MELYVYQAPGGAIADFRPYLDGHDHAFDDHRALPDHDARWEKIRQLVDPRTGELVDGQLDFVGTTECEWKELMMFPLAWDLGYDPAAVE